jgi:uncharacterized membrane protein
MNGLWHWNFQNFRKKIWFPITIFGILGVLTAVAAVALKPLVPADLPELIGSESVSTLLNILASSMLAVTTFALSIRFSAFAAATSSATPRATVLLKDDAVTRSVLATFTGAFIFSLSGIIGLQTGIYERSGRLILFVVTILVIAAVVGQLVRWIGHLSDFGRLYDTMERLEKAASSSLSAGMARPYLGGRSAGPDLPERRAAGVALYAPCIGYVQFIDMPALQACAKAAEVEVALSALPGTFVHPGAELLRVLAPTMPKGLTEDLLDSYAYGNNRTFDQDPRFGLVVLAEVASRALSPAVNDPGTAIDILTRQHRILSLWQNHPDHEVLFDRLIVESLAIADLFGDAFGPIARDGAGVIEVQTRLQKTLFALALADPAEFLAPARQQSARAVTLAKAALVVEEDKARLSAMQAQIEALA